MTDQIPDPVTPRRPKLYVAPMLDYCNLGGMLCFSYVSCGKLVYVLIGALQCGGSCVIVIDSINASFTNNSAGGSGGAGTK